MTQLESTHPTSNRTQVFADNTSGNQLIVYSKELWIYEAQREKCDALWG